MRRVGMVQCDNYNKRGRASVSQTTSVLRQQTFETRAGTGASVRAALFAAAFGFAILYVVGFAQPAAIHDAAHDTRHAAALPCH